MAIGVLKKIKQFSLFLKNKYPNSSIEFKIFFSIVDTLAALFSPRVSNWPLMFPPQRILIADGHHLGNVVIATSVLPLINRAFPNARIGFLIGSWSAAILQEHPLVHWTHIVDDYRLNRSSCNRVVKFRQYLRYITGLILMSTLWQIHRESLENTI